MGMGRDMVYMDVSEDGSEDGSAAVGGVDVPVDAEEDCVRTIVAALRSNRDSSPSVREPDAHGALER